MRFSILPWWGWLFCAGISAMIAIAGAMFQDEKGRPFPIIVGAVGSISAFLCGVIGIVLLVIWIRKG